MHINVFHSIIIHVSRFFTVGPSIKEMRYKNILQDFLKTLFLTNLNTLVIHYKTYTTLEASKVNGHLIRSHSGNLRV